MNLVPILIAEDDLEDQFILRESFKKARLLNDLHFVPDGEQLLRFLRRQAPFDDPVKYPTPGLILLDLNMPKVDGRTALKEIKKDDRLCTIPVVVFTTSKSEEDLYRSYQTGANSFISKPVEFEKFVEVIEGLNRYWFGLVDIPGFPKD